MSASHGSHDVNSPPNPTPQTASQSPADHLSPSTTVPSSNGSLPQAHGSTVDAFTPPAVFGSQSNPHVRAASQNSHPPLNQRSCLTCRRRKVRCSKTEPCSNCVKAGIECVFPGPGRARRKARRPADAELLARLRRLEGLVESLGANVLLNAPPPPPPPPPAISNAPQPASDGETSKGKSPANGDHHACPNFLDTDPKNVATGDRKNEIGRLVVEEGRSRYVSNRFWASLTEEVGRRLYILFLAHVPLLVRSAICHADHARSRRCETFWVPRPPKTRTTPHRSRPRRILAPTMGFCSATTPSRTPFGTIIHRPHNFLHCGTRIRKMLHHWSPSSTDRASRRFSLKHLPTSTPWTRIQRPWSSPSITQRSLV